jgi:hypothetical protein
VRVLLTGFDGWTHLDIADKLDRVQKLKDARSEAASEIEEYKSKKDQEYKKFESEVSHINDEAGLIHGSIDMLHTRHHVANPVGKTAYPSCHLYQAHSGPFGNMLTLLSSCLASAHTITTFHQQNSSQTTSSQSTIDASTKKQLADIESAIKENRDATVKKIVGRVLQCDPHLHPNLKKIEA